MKQYETYKDSRIPSIGTIPNSWRVVPIKYVLEQSANGIKIGPFGSTLTGKVSPANQVKVYGQWNVIGKDFSAGKNYVSEDTYQELESYWIHPNDILISMMGTVGKCAIIPKGVAKGIMDSHIVKVRLDETIILPQFFYYVYDKDGSNVMISQIQRDRRGSIMDGLNSTLIKSFIIPLPPLSEQQDIVSFLDEKVNMIDVAIAEKEQMLEDLKNYRSAIISEAVTKGLDKNVEMKDSGIEWIGIIPKHWNVSNIGRLFNIKAGGDAKPEFYSSTKDDVHKYPVYTNTKEADHVYAFSSYAPFSGNSITVTGRGDIGHAIFRSNEYDAIIRLLVLQPKIEDIIDSRYFAYFIDEKIHFFTDSAAVGQLSAIQISPYKICFPPIKEQRAISNYLDERIAQIDVLTKEIDSQISDLKSYKSALITEAVTGKIDLRDWKHKEENI